MWSDARQPRLQQLSDARTSCAVCIRSALLALSTLKLTRAPSPTGDAQTGWDTDQFLTDPRMATLVMAVVVKNNGLGSGGINFDAKIRCVALWQLARLRC